MQTTKVIKSETLSGPYEPRFVVVDADTGKVLDDAQGYGYRTPQKAHAAWVYKNRDRSKDKEKEQKRKHIRKWMKEHKDFMDAMDTFAFEITKGSWGPEDKFNAAFVGKMLKDYGLKTDFSAAELLKVWEKS